MKSFVTKDNTRAVVRALMDLAGQRVLVGVPAPKANREDGDAMNNAALAAIHEYGAPGANIPARPFLVPGVRKAEPKVIGHMKGAAVAALQMDSRGALAELDRSGLVAVNEVRAVFTDNDWPPLTEGTLERKTNSKGQVKSRPLIDTGQLRKSITYVVTKKGDTQ